MERDWFVYVLLSAVGSVAGLLALVSLVKLWWGMGWLGHAAYLVLFLGLVVAGIVLVAQMPADSATASLP